MKRTKSGHRKSSPSRGNARSRENIKWLERECFIPDGKYIGKPLRLRPWQKKIIHGIYAEDTRRVIISVGRKNGKTALSAMILLLHLCGPEYRPNSEMYSSAMSREQAAIIFRFASKMIRLNPALAENIVIREANKQLYCPDLGTMYHALSADAPTSYGLNPCLIIHDELGQTRGPRSALYEALETATGAQENPLSIIISTQAPTDADLLSVLIDDADKDPRTKLFLWTADKDEDAFTEKAVKQANPGLGDFQNKSEVMAMAQDAKRMPTREAEYRNLVLNQRVETVSPFVSPSVWRQNGGEIEGWGQVYAGLDLSETNDLTCMILASPLNGILNVKSVFWLPEEGLLERSRKDRVPYDMWVEQGHILTTPGYSVQYKDVAKYLVDFIDREHVRKIAFDRYNMKHLKPWLLEADLPDSIIEDVFEDFGQGTKSMHPALRELESLLLNGKVRHEMHPVLTMCAANAKAKKDEAGWRKFEKKNVRGRIDGMVGLAMATAVAAEDLHQTPVYPVQLDSITESINV